MSQISACRYGGIGGGGELVMELENYLLSPDQGERLLALCAVLKSGDMEFRGYDPAECQAAYDLVCNIGEEIALQIGPE